MQPSTAAADPTVMTALAAEQTSMAGAAGMTAGAVMRSAVTGMTQMHPAPGTEQTVPEISQATEVAGAQMRVTAVGTAALLPRATLISMASRCLRPLLGKTGEYHSAEPSTSICPFQGSGHTSVSQMACI